MSVFLEAATVREGWAIVIFGVGRQAQTTWDFAVGLSRRESPWTVGSGQWTVSET